MGNPKSVEDMDRSCTDVICLAVFVVFLIGYAAIGFLAFYNGDPRLLLHAQDSEGNLCGLNNEEWGGRDMEDRPYLFLFDISKCGSFPGVSSEGLEMCPTYKVCVPKCPKKYWTYLPDVSLYAQSKKEEIEYSDYMCQYGVDAATEYEGDPNKLIGQDKCASYYLDSFAMLGYCVPQILDDVANHGKALVIEDGDGSMYINGSEVKNDQNETVTLAGLISGADIFSSIMGATEKASSFFQDIYNAGWIIALFLGISLAVTLLCVFLLQFFVKIFVWTLLVIVLLSSGLLSAFFWYEWKWRYDEAQESGDEPEEFHITTNLSYYADLYTTYFILAVIATIIFAVMLFTVLFLFNRVRLAIQLIIEGSKCVLSNLTTLILPGVTWILMLGVLAFAVATGVYLSAFGVEVKNATSSAMEECDNSTGNCIKEQFHNCYVNVTDAGAMASSSNCFLMSFVSESYINIMQIYNIFGALWLLFFVIGSIQVIQAGVYADWFWHQGDTKLLPTTRSAYRMIRYHTGSVAFGSFLIATVTLIKMILEYVSEKLQKQDTSDMAKLVLKCVKCFVYCLEKAVKVINKNAYIVIACYGKNFCSAATEALRLLVENCLRVVVLNTITEALLFICQLGIIIGMGFLSYFAIKNDWLSNYYSSPELTYFFAPIIVIVAGTWVIAKLFFDVYDMAIDTIFICVLEDLEHFDGSKEKPYHMSMDLQRLLVKGDAHNITDTEENNL